MEVILLQDVEKLGLRGDVVDVARGYARNYLLPRRSPRRRRRHASRRSQRSTPSARSTRRARAEQAEEIAERSARPCSASR